MGLISGVLLLPLAPVRGVVWVAGKVHECADRELHDPRVIRAQLIALNREFEAGDISGAEFERAEEKLLDRLHAAQGRLAVRGRRPPNDRR
ncbi:gas vesicle protein GvpG [Streptomyces sp. SID8352]|uniref:gas vesicle protein GvpG n=1 Tax=Streptomyces sp. SID8352 TaxID=2690338 RepID=UPI001369E815|nr:gas vesicle protein GvpG [Streptomyces sp. SID8352]MYU25264.1 gas vesicle protein [Streptomyces sp. SID8352]